MKIIFEFVLKMRISATENEFVKWPLIEHVTILHAET